MKGAPKLFTITLTVLDEMARAICDRGYRRQPGELSFPHLAPEWKTLTDLLRRRATSPPSLTTDEFYIFAAMLITEGMVAQHLHDLRLAAQCVPPVQQTEKAATRPRRF